MHLCTPNRIHNGVNATVHKIQEWYWWRGITEDVRAFCKTCIDCAGFFESVNWAPVEVPTIGNSSQGLAVSAVGTLPHEQLPLLPSQAQTIDTSMMNSNFVDYNHWYVKHFIITVCFAMLSAGGTVL